MMRWGITIRLFLRGGSEVLAQKADEGESDSRGGVKASDVERVYPLDVSPSQKHLPSG